ncbi:hypothetical protein NF717_12465, partial [Lactococcus formosensis]
WLAGEQLNAISRVAPPPAEPHSIFLIPWYYVSLIAWLIWQALSHPALLAPGLLYSGCLLAILAAHESGHYFYCR